MDLYVDYNNKNVLNALHQGILEVYGTDYFEQNSVEDGYILILGVLKSKEKGNLCIALLELDMSSSGEHWGDGLLNKVWLCQSR